VTLDSPSPGAENVAAVPELRVTPLRVVVWILTVAWSTFLLVSGIVGIIAKG
jgi:hypothetical protein